MPDGSNPRTDIALALFLIVVCAAVLWETREIPPGVYEPLGSAPVPQGTAGLIVLLALVVMVRAWLALRRGAAGRVGDGEEDGFQPRPRDAAGVIALTALYVLAMDLDLASFAVLTALFLCAAIGMLVRFRARLLPAVVAVALAMAFGCQYVFTRVFVVDLPAGG